MRLALALAFCLTGLPALAQEATEPEVIPSVLVTGTLPGPGLWKLSKNEHVLWVMATWSPLPKKMAWRSREVESVIAQSQEFIDAPNAKPNIGFFRAMTLLPSAIGIMNNPDGAKLQDVVPPEAYARWSVLKQKYLPDDQGVEKTRPIFAAGTLYDRALDKSGLENSKSINATIIGLVKKSKLKVTAPHIEFTINDPRGIMKKFKTTPLDDLDCFTTTLARLETDLESMRTRANAWAMGDIELIESMSFPDQGKKCTSVMLASAALDNEPDFRNLDQRMKESWLAAAEKALATNQSTFAILPMHRILGPQGYIAALQAKGYELTAPR